MNKYLFLTTSIFVCLVCPVCAQGYFTDTHIANAIQLRDPARQASVDVDAAVSNPAGTPFLKDGFHISASGFALFQNIDAQSVNMLKPQETRNIRFAPALQFVYKKTRLALSASFANEGGYGHRKADYGTDIFYVHDDFDELSKAFQDASSKLYLIDALLGNKLGADILPEDKLSVATKDLSSKMYNYAIHLGVSYKLSDHMSVYLGGKANYVYYKNVFDRKFAVLRPSTGAYMAVSDYYSFDNSAISGLDLDDDLKQSLQEIVDYNGELGKMLDGIDLSRDLSVTGWGFAPVIGIDYKTGDFNFGAKYEFASHINAKNVSDFNIPALLSLGANWQYNNRLEFALGGDVAFTEDKQLGFVSESFVSWDVAASATYDFNKSFSISGGYTLASADYIVSDDFPITLQTSTPLIHKISFGGAWNVAKDVQLNAGVGFQLPSRNLNVAWHGDYEGECTYSYKSAIQMAVGANFSF